MRTSVDITVAGHSQIEMCATLPILRTSAAWPRGTAPDGLPISGPRSRAAAVSHCRRLASPLRRRHRRHRRGA
jgi:hypothetical protein